MRKVGFCIKYLRNPLVPNKLTAIIKGQGLHFADIGLEHPNNGRTHNVGGATQYSRATGKQRSPIDQGHEYTFAVFSNHGTAFPVAQSNLLLNDRVTLGNTNAVRNARSTGTGAIALAA